jgi:hypothetical protein
LIFALEASIAAPAIDHRCPDLSLIPSIKHKFSSATGTSISFSFIGAISIWDQSMAVSVELLPSLDWIIFELHKLVVSVVDSLIKKKYHFLVKKLKHNNENYF